MNYFININAQSNGDHEVYVEGCCHSSLPGHHQCSVRFSSCELVCRKAKKPISLLTLALFAFIHAIAQ